MALQGLNAVAALAIMRQANAPREEVGKTVALAAVVPGLLGLAVPLIASRRWVDGWVGESRDTNLVRVPDVSNAESFDDAEQVLTASGLTAAREDVYVDDLGEGVVFSQDPAAGEIVVLGREVSVRVSAGAAPGDEVIVISDLDQDITEKLAASERRIEERIERSRQEIMDQLRAMMSADR